MRESLLNKNNINDRISRDSTTIEREFQQFLVEHEGDMIVNDILLLEDMGYDKKMINKLYILLHPENIERAIEYMNEIDGIYQHDYFENYHKGKEKGLCFICKKPKRNHINYIPEDLNENNNQNNIEDDILLVNNNNNNNNNDSIINVKENKDEDNINDICNVCYEDIEEEDKKFNILPCGHICCTQCWINYLKTLILEAKVEEIKCVEHKCKEIISEDFILKHIKNDTKLVEKYDKFKKRANILKDPNKKQCPYPDCDSFLVKEGNKKYVTCEKGHEYCFECLRKPHGVSSCDEFMEKEFLLWKKNKRVKRCPRCKIYTEKNEGCNHMTCTNCKYQWCWLCEGEYKYGHYDSGKCMGYQFTVADSLEQAQNVKVKNNYSYNYNYNYNNNLPYCCFTLKSIFPCFYSRAYVINDDPCWLNLLFTLLMWILGFLGFVMHSLFNNKFIDDINETCTFSILTGCIGFCLFICYQITFTCLITPFILIAFAYPKFITYIFRFLELSF